MIKLKDILSEGKIKTINVEWMEEYEKRGQKEYNHRMSIKSPVDSTKIKKENE